MKQKQAIRRNLPGSAPKLLPHDPLRNTQLLSETITLTTDGMVECPGRFCFPSFPSLDIPCSNEKGDEGVCSGSVRYSSAFATANECRPTDARTTSSRGPSSAGKPRTPLAHVAAPTHRFFITQPMPEAQRQLAGKVERVLLPVAPKFSTERDSSEGVIQ